MSISPLSVLQIALLMHMRSTRELAHRHKCASARNDMQGKHMCTIEVLVIQLRLAQNHAPHITSYYMESSATRKILAQYSSDVKPESRSGTRKARVMICCTTSKGPASVMCT